MANRSNGNELCILCGERKRKGHPEDLLGPQCYKRWLEDSGKRLGQTGVDWLLLQWTLEQAEKIQKDGQLERELEQVQEEYRVLSEQVGKDAYAEIKSMLTRYVAKEKFDAALRAKREIIWATKGGNKIFGRLKALEFRIRTLPGFTNTLKEKIEAATKEAPENTQQEDNEHPPENQSQNPEDVPT